MIPKLEEYMGFVDNNGNSGIILKYDDTYYSWRKCFKENGGQVFNENDFIYKKISKLYKCIKDNEDDKKFYAMKFMLGKDMDMFKCVYDKNKEELKVINCTINISIPSNMNVDDISGIVARELKQVNKFR